MSEGVCAQVSNACSLSCPVKLSPKSSVRVRQSSELQRTGENPIAVRWELCALLPHFQSVEELVSNVQRLPRLLGFYAVHLLLNDAAFDDNLPLTQSTSDHRSAKHSETRRPKQTQTRAIVPNGSRRWDTNKWNCSAVRLRGCRILFDTPLIFTRLIGLTCIGMSCFHIAKFHRALRMPRTWVRLLGARVRDSNHISTGRACRSVIRFSPHFGRIGTRIQDSYSRFVSNQNIDERKSNRRSGETLPGKTASAVPTAFGK